MIETFHTVNILETKLYLEPEPSAPALREQETFDRTEQGYKVDDRFCNKHAYKEQQPEKWNPKKKSLRKRRH